MRARFRIGYLALVVCIAASCSGDTFPSPLGSQSGTSRGPAIAAASQSALRVGDTTVTVGAGAAPGPGCSATQVALRFQSFLAAFNAGDQTALPGFFERDPTFTEFNPPPAGVFKSGGRQQLLDYFAARHANHESRRLVTLQLSYGSQGDRDRVDFGFTIQRSSDDTNGLAPGKGLMSCAALTISIWGMGTSSP